MEFKANIFFFTVVLVFFLVFLKSIESSATTKQESSRECKKKKSDAVEIVPGAEYFIYNKNYLNTRITQWGESSRNVGTYSRSEMHEGQLWRIEESDDDNGKFYIINVRYSRFRLAKWSGDEKTVVVFSGNHYTDQLWMFVKVGEYYRIFNFAYPEAKLAKPTAGDDAFGTFSGKDYDDQLWRLVPRYKATSVNSVILHIRNGGSMTITEQRSVTVGVTVENENSVSATVGFSASVSASLKGILDVSQEISTQISSKVSSKDTTSWSKTSTVTYEIKPRTEYIVYQNTIDFDSSIPSGSFSFLSKYDVREKAIK